MAIPTWFDADKYVNNNPDLQGTWVADSDANAWDHYQKFGADEGRVVNFNASEYNSSYPDVDAASITAAKHYVTYGMEEGRALNFNATDYLANNPDVDDAGLDALTHYKNYGMEENRPVTFDSTKYLNYNPDVANSVYGNDANGPWNFNGSEVSKGALAHYLKYGKDEGRPVEFDSAKYLDTYTDVDNSVYGNDANGPWKFNGAEVTDGALAHYLKYGKDEGRNPTPGETIVPAEEVSLTADASSYNEGQTASFSLSSDLSDGTEVAYTIGGDVNADDVSGSLTGTTTVDASGNATIDVTLLEDGATEGDETLTISLDDYTVDASTTVKDVQVGETFTLTEVGAFLDGSTNVGVTPEDTYTTDANDTIRTDSDNLDGSYLDGVGGDNTLNIYTFNSSVSPSNVENIQTVDIAGRANEELDAGNMVDVDTWTSVGSRSGHLDIVNIQEIATVAMRGDHDDIEFDPNFDGSVTDNNDAVDVNLDSVGVRATNGATLDIDGFQTFNVSNIGESTLASLESNANDVTKVNVTGDGDLTVDGMSNAVATVDAGTFEGNLAVAYGDASDEDISFTSNTGDDELDLTGITSQTLDNANSDLEVDMGEGNDEVALGSLLQFDIGDWAGDTISVDGGAGSNELILAADDNTGTNSFAGIIADADVTIKNFQDVGIEVDQGALDRFDMADLEGATDFGFAAGDTDANNVKMSAEGYSDIFELSFFGNIDNANDLGTVNVNNIGESSDQTSATATYTAALSDNGGYDSGADNGNNSQAITDELQFETSTANAGITDLTLVSNLDGTLDPDQLNDPDIGSLDADTGDMNQVNGITSTDSDSNEILESLTVNASDMNFKSTGAINTLAGDAGSQTTFALNLQGEGAIDLQNLAVGANTNVLDITNAGAGDRSVDLDTGAVGGLVDADYGNGVQISGDGTGKVQVVADTGDVINTAPAEDQYLTVNADDYTTGDAVVSFDTIDGGDAVDLRNFTNLTEIVLNDAISSSGLDAKNFAEGDLRIAANLTNALTLSSTDTEYERDSLNVVMDDSLDTDNHGLTADFAASYLKTLSVQVEDTETATNVDFTDTGNLMAADGSSSLESLNMTVDSTDDTLQVGTHQVRTIDPGASNKEFDVALDGAGNASMDAITGSGELENLNIDSQGEGTLTVDSLTGDATNINLTATNADSAVTVTTLDTDRSTARIDMAGDGDVEITTLNADDSNAGTVSQYVIVDVTGNGEHSLGALNLGNDGVDYFRITPESSGENAFEIGDLTLTGSEDQALQLRGEQAVEISSDVANTINDSTTLTIDSANGTDENVFDIADGTTGNLILGSAGTGNAKLEITGDQDLTINDTNDTSGTQGKGIQTVDASGSTQEIDASAFTGNLDIELSRTAGATGDTNQNQHVFKVGQSETIVEMDESGTNNSEDTYSFQFTSDGVSQFTITNFSTAGGNSGANAGDILDYQTNDIFGTDVTISSYDTTEGTDAALLDDAGNVLIDFEEVTEVFDTNSSGTVGTIQEGDFAGEQIGLVGVDDVTNLGADNFAGAA